MKKQGMALFLTVVLCFTVLLPSYAASGSRYIDDELDILTEEELSALNQEAGELHAKTGYDVRFLMTDELGEDGSLYQLLEKRYTALSGSKDGLILGYARAAKRWSVYSTGKAAAFMNDDTEDSLWNAFYQTDDFYSGIQAYLQTAETLLSGDPVTVIDPSLNGVRLVDQANLLTDRQEESLHAKLDEISERQGLDIVVVTVNSLGGKSARDYADDYYDYNGYAGDGILFLLAMREREWYISTTGYGITVVTDAGLDYMEDQFIDDLKDGDYADAFNIFADLCDDFITRANKGKAYDVGNLPREPLSLIWIPISLAVGAMIAAIGTGIMKSKLKSVRYQPAASNYLRDNSLHITNAQEIFLYYHVDRTERAQSSSSGGGSSTHTSSSGSSHGGGGGRF